MRKPTTCSKFSICFFFFIQKLFSRFKWQLFIILWSRVSDLLRHDVMNISGLNFMSRCNMNFHWTRYFIEDKPQHVLFLWRVTYFHPFDVYILKIHREINKLHGVEVHMHHGQATTYEIFRAQLWRLSADYDVSPSLRFSHATAHLLIYKWIPITGCDNPDLRIKYHSLQK